MRNFVIVSAYNPPVGETIFTSVFGNFMINGSYGMEERSARTGGYEMASPAVQFHDKSWSDQGGRPEIFYLYA